MEPQAATPTGAEASARADVSSQPEASIHDRIKASFGAPKEVEHTAPVVLGEPSVETPAKSKAKAEPEAEVEETADEPAEIETDDDALTEVQLSSLNELAEQTGLEMDKLMDLDVPTKIDGKEGKVRLRDLIKSHQLEGHLNQKLMTHAEERKAFEAEIANKRGEQQQQFMQLNAAVQVATRMLEGEMSGIDWAALQQNDPLEFNQKYVAFQQRQAQIQQIGQQIAQERQQAEQQMAGQRQAYLAEQGKLLEMKLPEWSDKATRTKDIAEMVSVLGEAYGVTEKELKNETDHRLIRIARDAMKWQQLQKSKPAVLKKVNVAPRLLKPGVPQSKAAQDALASKGARDRLKTTGKVADAKQVLKQILFR